MAEALGEPARGDGDDGGGHGAGDDGEAGGQDAVAPDRGEEDDVGQDGREERHPEQQRREVRAVAQQLGIDHRARVQAAALEGDRRAGPLRPRTVTTMRALVQPHSPPSRMPSASRPSPTITSATPSMSGRPCRLLVAWSRRSRAARRGRRARRAAGWRRRPSASRRPRPAGRRARARRRPRAPRWHPRWRPRTRAARGGYSGSTSASETATITAAPAPCSARPATSTSQPGASAHTSRGGDEHGQAGAEDALAADPVRDRARGHEQRGHHDEVGVEDPRELGRAGLVEGRRDVRERGVDDRRVQEREEAARARGRDRGGATAHAKSARDVGRGVIVGDGHAPARAAAAVAQRARCASTFSEERSAQWALLDEQRERAFAGQREAVVDDVAGRQRDGRVVSRRA